VAVPVTVGRGGGGSHVHDSLPSHRLLVDIQPHKPANRRKISGFPKISQVCYDYFFSGKPCRFHPTQLEAHRKHHCQGMIHMEVLNFPRRRERVNQLSSVRKARAVRARRPTAVIESI